MQFEARFLNLHKYGPPVFYYRPIFPLYSRRLIMLDSFVQDLLEKSLCVNLKNVVPNWKVLLYFFDVLEASLLIKVSCGVRMTQ